MRAELSAPFQLKNDREPPLIGEAVEIENAALVLDLKPSRLLGHEHIVCLSHVLARVVFLGAIDDEVRSHFDFTVGVRIQANITDDVTDLRMRKLRMRRLFHESPRAAREALLVVGEQE